MIAIVDPQMGNLRSVQKALEHVGLKARVTRSARAIREASALVLPGVGAFADCMHNLRSFGLIDPILRAVESGKPFLGICLGMQVLFDYSEEFGRRKGLGLIPGRVVRFPPGARDAKTGESLKIPHMGWNRVRVSRRNRLFQGIRSGSHFYFVHSYHAVCENPDHIAAESEHGIVFTAAIRKDNIYACQFHPEKSQGAGLKFLSNFGAML